MRQPRPRVVAALALAATLGVGCYRVNSGLDVPDTVVRVDNQSFIDYNIYVLPEASPQVRLGLATSNKRSTFVIPHSAIGSYSRQLRFVARPLATQAGSVTQEMVVAPGDTVGLLIPPG